MSIALAVRYVEVYSVYMRMKGVLRKKPVGLAIMDLRQLVIVCWIGKPLEAFSMMALEISKDLVSI